MAGASLLALLDDIAVILDDVAVMTKTAAKKTAGVLGDDLALNANQVQGVRADRELPVVWKVAVGSFINKLILVPLALVLSALSIKFDLPWLITVPLMVGGLYLCFEGAEKIIHKVLHPKEDAEHKQEHKQANSSDDIDLVAFEQNKIKGAIRTDFILSAEIIVIAMGSALASGATFTELSLVLSIIAIAMTIGVYGLVAGIVKLDDFGLWLYNKNNAVLQLFGKGLLAFAPLLMKFLSIAGTLAMFLVGGSIIVHNIAFVHHLQIAFVAMMPSEFIGTSVFDLVFGFVVGAVVVALLELYNKFKG